VHGSCPCEARSRPARPARPARPTARSPRKPRDELVIEFRYDGDGREPSKATLRSGKQFSIAYVRLSVVRPSVRQSRGNVRLSSRRGQGAGRTNGQTDRRTRSPPRARVQRNIDLHVADSATDGMQSYGYTLGIRVESPFPPLPSRAIRDRGNTSSGDDDYDSTPARVEGTNVL